MSKPFCEDWSCPSRWSCARAWCRSEAYWAFDIEARVDLYKGPRNPHRAACEDYRRDVARPWLASIWDVTLPGGAPPRGFTLYLVDTEAADV